MYNDVHDVVLMSLKGLKVSTGRTWNAEVLAAHPDAKAVSQSVLLSCPYSVSGE